MSRFKNQRGFAIIELLIGIFLFAVIFVGISYLMLDNIQNSFDNQERVKADFLVAQGLEAVKAIAGNDWDQIKPGQYGLALANNQWQLISSPEQVAQMAKAGERVITISDVEGDNLKKVNSKVVWLSVTNNVKNSEATTYLSNWREFVSACADGLDNDGDGSMDYPDDPGCSSPDDEDETDPLIAPQCSDGQDNDGDGNVDYPNDPGCSSADDDEETDPTILPICADGLDNDGDGLADYPADPGCCAADDNDETDPLNLAQCSDGIDNDGDGKIDWPSDPNCLSADDDDESSPVILPVCSDGKDNDNDLRIDYPEDPGCSSLEDNDETDPLNLPQCSDGIDNDGDGKIDWPADPGCASAEDNDETNSQIQPACADGLDNDGDGLIDYPNDLGCSSANDDDETNPVVLPQCLDNDNDGYNQAKDNCGSADCADDNPAVYPGAVEICNNGIDDNCDGLIDCQDSTCAGQEICKPVEPDVIFDEQDKALCRLDSGSISVTGKVVLPVNLRARLQLSYYVIWPADRRTDIIYVNKGLVSNGDTFSLETPWPGIRPGEVQVETHVGAMLLDVLTGNPIMAHGASLDYYWYPWVCPAPQTQCSDGLDNDNDSKIDFPADPNCLSYFDDTEGSESCGEASDNQYDFKCNNDDETEQLEISVTNNTNRGLSDVAISLPPGVVPVEPQNGDNYVGQLSTYRVEITNNPYYSIKFNTIGEGMKNGGMEIFIIKFAPEDYAKLNEITVQAKSALIIGRVILNLLVN